MTSLSMTVHIGHENDNDVYFTLATLVTVECVNAEQL